MKLLAIDTAANLCAAALYDMAADKVLAQQTLDIGTGHAERLMDLIDSVLAEGGASYATLGKLAVSIGPGSFTGVRVGVSTARGLALALKLPLVGISTLEALAADARTEFPGKPVMSVIDARREQAYSALYDADGTCLAEPDVKDLDATAARLQSVSDVILTGSGAAMLAEHLGTSATNASQAASASIETYARIGAGRAEGEKPAPLYLRGADAKKQASFILPGKPA